MTLLVRVMFDAGRLNKLINVKEQIS
jgi:hypothetical protein